MSFSIIMHMSNAKSINRQHKILYMRDISMYIYQTIHMDNLYAIYGAVILFAAMSNLFLRK